MISDAAAPRTVLVPVLIALGVGAILIIPALAYLHIIFKTRPRPGH